MRFKYEEFPCAKDRLIGYSNGNYSRYDGRDEDLDITTYQDSNYDVRAVGFDPIMLKNSLERWQNRKWTLWNS